MRRLICSAVAVALLMVGQARANVVTPGSSTTPDIYGDVSGTVLATYTNTYSASPSLGGEYTEIVLKDSVTGLLDFVYQFKETGGTDSVGRITADHYTGFATDIGIATTLNLLIANDPYGLGTAQPKLIGGVDRDAGGNVVGFNFDKTGLPTDLTPGSTSMLLVIKTDASDFQFNHTGVIDGIPTIASPTVGPAPAGGGLLAPLPSTAGLGLVLLGGLGFGRGRRANLA